MCRICGKYICPPPCPSYMGESAERGKMIGRCNRCGDRLCEYDYLRYAYEKLYCHKCYKIMSKKRGDYERGKRDAKEKNCG